MHATRRLRKSSWRGGCAERATMPCHAPTCAPSGHDHAAAGRGVLCPCRPTPHGDGRSICIRTAPGAGCCARTAPAGGIWRLLGTGSRRCGRSNWCCHWLRAAAGRRLWRSRCAARCGCCGLPRPEQLRRACHRAAGAAVGPAGGSCCTARGCGVWLLCRLWLCPSRPARFLHACRHAAAAAGLRSTAGLRHCRCRRQLVGRRHGGPPSCRHIWLCGSPSQRLLWCCQASSCWSRLWLWLCFPGGLGSAANRGRRMAGGGVAGMLHQGLWSAPAMPLLWQVGLTSPNSLPPPSSACAFRLGGSRRAGPATAALRLPAALEVMAAAPARPPSQLATAHPPAAPALAATAALRRRVGLVLAVGTARPLCRRLTGSSSAPAACQASPPPARCGAWVGCTTPVAAVRCPCR